MLDDNLPWIEKYRPLTLNNIVSNNENINTIKKLLKANVLPHLLFYGIPGTGKTSTIMAIAKELYGNNIKLMTLILDASDDRGINSVREDIKGFAEKSNIFIKGVKLIILDEADAMTYDAQFALRRIIEKYSDTIRFCLICNYENKIIPAIRSRFFNFKFNLITKDLIIKKLKEIAINENMNISDDSIFTISQYSYGDLRKAINLLHSISLYDYDKKINNTLCCKIIGIPLYSEILQIYELLNNNSILFNNKYLKIYNFIRSEGYSLNIILHELLNIILIKNINPTIILKLANLENMILKSISHDIYISGLISIFI